MKRLFSLLLLVAFATGVTFAQRTISGKIIDKDTKEGVMQATVSLLKRDSTFVKGVISDENGKFSVTAPANGSYILKITSVAYKTLRKTVTVSGDKNVALGNVILASDAIMLKEAVATGQAARVVVKADTFEYNAAAYHTPEGSVVEELVKRLPGAQIDDSGKITINGKEVKKILVDGKEFMTGDTETALKNLPTSIVDKVRSFDQKSDLARVTGIDDGEEETVLDFGIKKGMNRGTMGNFDLSLGTQKRYAERGMLAYMKDNLRIMGFGSFNNVNDMGFPGGGGGPRFGGGSNGLNAKKMVGVNINYQNDKILTIDGSARWNHSNGDVASKVSGESFLGTTSSFNNSRSTAYSRGDQFNANMRLEWNPDTMTNIMFRPRVSLSKTDNTSASTSAVFNADPYETVDNPLDDVDKENESKLLQLGKLVNSTHNTTLSYSESNSVSGMAQYNRKFGKAGRNITLRFDGSYSDGESRSATLQDVYLALNDSSYQTNRYNTTPTKSYSFTGKFTYSEPLGKAFFLLGSYSLKYSKSKSDRSTFDYSKYTFPISDFYNHEFRDWDSFFLGKTGVYDSLQSKSSEYDTYTHEIALQLRKIGKKWNYTVGLMLQPQNTRLAYKYNGLDTIVKRNVLNFAPSLDLRYKISQVSQLRATYRANNSQPSMTDLLDITDDSDKLNIKKGNPNLKPSFTHNFRLFYNGFSQFHTQSWMAHLHASITKNSVSSMVKYDSTTGGKITTPENINGNWSAGGALMYNCSIDSTGVWNFNTFTDVNHNNYVSYLYQDNVSQENTTRSTTIGERLAFSYRNSWLEVEPNGRLSYSHTRNMLQSQSNLDTYSFNYGMNITINAPWGTGFSTDAHMNSRRGYNDASMNTNEFVWNAQVSQSFLKGSPLTVSLQFYDILKKQSTLSRVISSTQRTDSEYNAINSYAMLHVIYRFNNFGGKGSRGEGPDGRPDFHDPRFRGGGPMGGGRPGGFGGGHRGPM